MEEKMSWTKEQYNAMQEKAHELGYHLLTPYRKNLKNIRVGVIKDSSYDK
jgi:hypothetical protein